MRIEPPACGSDVEHLSRLASKAIQEVPQNLALPHLGELHGISFDAEPNVVAKPTGPSCSLST